MDRGDARLWVVAVNDGEAKEVVSLLHAHGERVVESAQAWGASWSGLENDVVRSIEQFRQDHAAGRIYGVELAGGNPYGAINVDHHKYDDDDRSHPLSSLEQVAEILGVALDRRQQLVALNDRGYIPAMEEQGATIEEIAQVRRQDREAQGLSEADEQRAASDIGERAEWQDRRVMVRCQERGTSAHTDLLYGKAEEVLLAGEVGNWTYTGPRHQWFANQDWEEESWSGGDVRSGFFGLARPGPASQQKLAALFFGESPQETVTK